MSPYIIRMLLFQVNPVKRLTLSPQKSRMYFTLVNHVVLLYIYRYIVRIAFGGHLKYHNQLEHWTCMFQDS